MPKPEELARLFGPVGNPCPACGERMLHPSEAELQAELNRVRAENERLKALLWPVVIAYEGTIAVTGESDLIEGHIELPLLLPDVIDILKAMRGEAAD